MGSFSDASLPQSTIVAGFLAAGMAMLMTQARAMDIFALGEEAAQQLGVEADRFKTILVVTSSLLTAASVAVAGVIGFVGLVVPHMARRLAGTPRHGRVLPLAAILGAILLVLADTAARSIMPDGREIPVGLITAFLGGPFFLLQLRKQAAADRR
jgi:iron complex transport system permease protein